MGASQSFFLEGVGAAYGNAFRRATFSCSTWPSTIRHPRAKTAPAISANLDNLHIVSPISMLGDLIPVMAGVAIAGRYLGQKIVTMTWIGDGGSSTGVFHEGLNFAATQKAPFVLILENNLWAYSTPVRRQVPLENLADRAKAYGIASYIVDGNDVVAMYKTAKEAVDRARAGEGPILIEAKSFRRMGHAQHDPAEYVPKEMRAYWEARDPILLYEKFLTSENCWTPRAKGNRRQNRRTAAERARLRGKFSHAAGGIRRPGRLLHRRRLPQGSGQVGTRQARSNAAEIQRTSRLDRGRLGAGKARAAESRQFILATRRGRGKSGNRREAGAQVGSENHHQKEIRQDRGRCCRLAKGPE